MTWTKEDEELLHELEIKKRDAERQRRMALEPIKSKLIDLGFVPGPDNWYGVFSKVEDFIENAHELRSLLEPYDFGEKND